MRTSPAQHGPRHSAVELALRGYDPTVRPPVLADGDVSYTVEDTRIGRMVLAVRGDGAAVATVFAATDDDVDVALRRIARVVSPRVLRGGPSVEQLRRELAEFLDGGRRQFDVRVDLTLATGFQRTVLTRLATVGYGSRTTYGALAAAIERPTASRAVGAALGANPLCVVLPCHRVLSSSGALTGYAGGVEAKRALLSMESSAAL